MKAVSGQSGTGRTSTAPRVRTGRRAGIAAAVVVVAALGLSGCATGQDAATATNKPAVTGTGGTIGSVELQDVYIQAPAVAGRPSGDKFYLTGDNAPMTITMLNVGHTADTLTSVTSTAFSSWAIVNTAALTQPVTGGATSQVLQPNQSVGLGLTGLGVGIGSSDQTLVLRGLTAATKTLYPGATVDVNFTFATAGTITLHVPVELSDTPTTGSIAPASGDSGA